MTTHEKLLKEAQDAENKLFRLKAQANKQFGTQDSKYLRLREIYRKAQARSLRRLYKVN